jgi:hypothetical protein
MSFGFERLPRSIGLFPGSVGFAILKSFSLLMRSACVWVRPSGRERAGGAAVSWKE